MTDVLTYNRLAQVVHVLPTEKFQMFHVVLNRGAADGVKLGNRFLVFGFGPELFDVADGESLGPVELVRGRGEIVHVQERLATPRSTEQRQRITKRITPRDLVAMFASPLELTDQVVVEDLPFLNPEVGDQAKRV